MIMDGNKRWSKLNNVDVKDGYLKGLYKIKDIVKICIEENIKHLTLYALSSENTKRPSVSLIFEILTDEYKHFFEDLDFKNDVKVKIIGEKKGLPHNVLNILTNIENQTKENNKNKKIIINETLLQEQMYLSNIPDPDLLIRTGGFQGLSNFLLLKLSYTELFFTKTFWPDLDKKELLQIFENYRNIKRNYGL